MLKKFLFAKSRVAALQESASRIQDYITYRKPAGTSLKHIIHI